MYRKYLLLSLIFLVVTQVVGTETSAAAVASGASTQRKAVETKFAIVDLDKIFNMESTDVSLEYRDRMKDLEDEAVEAAKKLKADEERGRQLQQELASKEKSKWASDESREAKYEELEKLQQKLQLGARELETKMQRKSGTIQAEVLAKVHKAAERVRKEQGWDIIWTTTAQVPVGPTGFSDRVEVTKDVVTILNKEYKPKKPVAAKPKAEESKKEETKSVAPTAATK